ncbi:MAG: copper amine oxidase N-terminal domain-containing protein [Oscillospiraceae bacterium]|nr:copper amine oxidase N-terminal domain-containing protein [Oscillospiraceae bacterium]
MKRWRCLLCAALSTALLGIPVVAAGEVEYTITRRGEPPVLVWGQVTTLDETQITLEGGENAPYASIVLNLSEDTIILDAVNGAVKAASDLKEGETLYAYAGPAMTRSLPPIATAVLVLCNLPESATPPTYAEVEQVLPGEDGQLSLLMTGEIVLHLSGETKLLAAPDATEPLPLESIQPGTRLLSWYDVVMESYPAQAVPEQVMIFPSDYTGWIRASLEELVLDGQILELSQAQRPITLDGHLMLPLRPIAERLGGQVEWDAANPSRIAVTGASNYVLTLDRDTVTVEEDMVLSLTHRPVAVNGVTFLAAEDVILLHQLKLEGLWPQV